MNLGSLVVTFYGHATFGLKITDRMHWMLDPWLEENPACPDRLKNPPKIDTILISHPHFDHIGDALRLATRDDALCACIAETATWLRKKGVKKTLGFNKGGTADIEGIKVTMTHAVHSCGITDGDEIIYGGEAAGYVITLPSGLRLYHAGDTCVFSDMKLIGELYRPDIAFLPIGDFYTMDPLQGSHAIRLLGTKVVVPMHYGTFPALTGTPEKLRELTADISGLRIIDIKPGETLVGEVDRLVTA
jgi:L-ascorbate metabolism protein UlaG (beta-lactamase superfamily)